MPVVATDPFPNPATAGATAWGIPIDSAATHAIAITPSDTDDLATVCRAVYVGTTGDLVVTLRDDTGGTSVKFTAVPAGALLSIRAKRIWSTGTTASTIVAIW